MSELVSQPSAAPTRKVTAVMMAGAGATVLAWLAGHFGLNVPPGVESAFGVLIAGAAGYFTKDRA